MEKKYELLNDDVKTIGSEKLYRVRAIRDFADVKSGDLGGYVAKEENLSHDDSAWVWGNAWVYGDAQVCGNAQVWGNTRVCDNARVYGYAQVCDNAYVYGNACVCGDARVYGNACVYGNSRVCGNARVYGNARVCDNAYVYGDARVYGDAQVYGNAWVYGNARVYDSACVYGDAQVYGNAQVCDNSDYLYIKGIGSVFRSTTAYRAKDDGIGIVCGCFSGTLDEFEHKVRQTHGENKFAKEYQLFVQIVKLHFGIEE